MSRGKSLSSEEERFIWQHRYDMPIRKIAELLDRSDGTVLHYFKKHGISYKTKQRR